ncbi:hypothetical protein MTsPCn3_03860 [Erythrobacter sp. MTPC3]
MKKSKNWVRQEDLDEKLDGFVEEMGGIPPGMKPNEIADRLGLTANGEFYRKFRDWKRRRDAEADLPALEIPEEARIELESVLAETHDLVMDQFVRVVRSVAGDIDRTATLRVRAAERRAADCEADTENVLERWNETERDLEVARERALSAEREAEKLRREVDRLRGQLDERARQLAEARADAASGNIKGRKGDVGESDSGKPRSGMEGGSLARPPAHPAEVGEEVSSASEPSSSEPEKCGPSGSAKSSSNEDDGHQVHQAELSLDSASLPGKWEARDGEND